MINVDFRNGQPLYRQVEEGFKRLILCGALAEGEKLPSVRELAGRLAINPNTIQRAYRELEAGGFIGTSPGKGVFVLGGEGVREAQIAQIYQAALAEIAKLRALGLDTADILDKLRALLGSER